MRRTGIVRDQLYLEHKTGIHHIEIPQRLETIYKMLDEDGYQDGFHLIKPRFATMEELEMVHTPHYIERILDTAGESRRYLDPDTVTSERSCEAAYLAVGGVFNAVQAVITGELDNAFALVRPPGHHAERNRPMGFCIFNNEALAAEFGRRKFGLQKILIIDWDVHHPNGIQHIFYDSPEILLFSTHRFPFFPGSGNVTAVGTGAGKGFTVNVPLTPKKGDLDFCNIYRHLLVPVALEFKPQLILIAAGFDCHQEDPIGGMSMTEQGFARLSQIVLEVAQQTCDGKVVAVIEGGYDLTALKRSARAVLETMRGSNPEDMQALQKKEDQNYSRIQETIEKVKEVQRPYWQCFKDA